MDEFIDKLEQNDKTFIETLNKNFEEYQKIKTKAVKEKTLKPKCTWQRRNIPIAGRNVVAM